MAIKATLILEKDSQTRSIAIGTNALVRVVEAMPDDEGHADVFEMLADHTDSVVREAIAAKDRLERQTLVRLSSDPAMAVVRKLIGVRHSKERLEVKDVLAICHRDPSLASQVANSFEDYIFEDSTVVEFLASHPDRQVRHALAGNPFAPKQILRRMSDADPDADIRETARSVML